MSPERFGSPLRAFGRIALYGLFTLVLIPVLLRILSDVAPARDLPGGTTSRQSI